MKISKIIILSLLLAILSLSAFAKKKTKDGEAMIQFKEAVYDFGIIDEKKGPVSHDFDFINAGNGNLVIYTATAECGCTRPEYPKNPIAPGKKGKVKVTYNPAGRPGSFEKVVTVKTNGRQKKVRLKIRGSVTPK